MAIMERMMVRCLFLGCAPRIGSQCFVQSIRGLPSVAEVVRNRWFGHVELLPEMIGCQPVGMWEPM